MTVRVADAVRAVRKLLLGYPEVAVEVVPRVEPGWWRRELVPEGGSPEVRQTIGICAVDHELDVTLMLDGVLARSDIACGHT